MTIPHQNHLLQLLPAQERARLLALCDPIDLVLSDVLDEPGRRTRSVYFPTQGFISLIAPHDGHDGHPGLEVGMVGHEGMLGAHLALGVPAAPLQALVQGEGACWRIAALSFRKELAASPALQRVLARYVYVLMRQLSTAAACVRYHLIGPRLARWLLMSQDRARSSEFRMTQEFLSHMLGVRRVGITAAASALQRLGLIAYHRGEIKVLDRMGLEAAACSCYANDRLAYTTTLG
jgi:CRP-like cAMP-binding protein